MGFTRLLVCASLTGILVITAVGQGRAIKAPDCAQGNENVERKEDRFTGETTVSLKPQTVTAALEQRLKVALRYKIKPGGRGHAESFIPETVDVVFTSEAPGRVYPGETELVFLIDGERVRRVPAAVNDDRSRLAAEGVITQTVFTGMTVETLRRIVRAKTVEMKLGDTEVKLNSELLDAIRAFAGCALAGN
jgi:hypothetical protein